MIQRRIVLLLLVISCFSCASDDAETADACALVDCATVSLQLEFVTANTGEDLFSNTIFTIDDLQIINTDSDQTVNFSVFTIGTTDRMIIALPTFTESSEIENYQISISDEFEIPFKFSVEVIADPCCVGNIYTNVAIDADNVTIENTDFATYRLLF